MMPRPHSWLKLVVGLTFEIVIAFVPQPIKQFPTVGQPSPYWERGSLDCF